MAIQPQTLRLVQRLRVQVGKEADTATRTLTQAWVRAWDEVAAAWRVAMDDVVAQAVADGQWPGRWQLARTHRLQLVLDASTDALVKLGDQTGVQVTDAAGQAAQYTAEAEPQIITSQLPGGQQADALSVFAGRGAPQTAVDFLVARTAQQITALTRPLSAQATEAMRLALIRGIAVGSNLRDAARDMVARVQGQFEGGLTRAMVIARTETLDAYRRASALVDQQHAEVLQGWTWISTLDSRTCPACWSMHGTEHTLDEPGPLGHQQCVVPGAVVEGPPTLASSTRWYRGEVVDIETDGGHRLTVTPNHPVLTPDGWVAACELHEGSYVVCGSGLQGGTPAGDDPYDRQVPALVEDVAQALGGPAAVLSVAVPTAAEDFHGDGAGSDVHVVRANGLLLHRAQTALAQQAGQRALDVGAVGEYPFGAGFAALRAVDSVLDGLGLPAGRGLCREHQASVLFGWALRSRQSVGVGDGAQFHARVDEAAVDQPAGDAKACRDLVGGLTGQVALNNFIGGNVGAYETGVHSAARGVSLGLGAPESAVDEDRLEPLLRGSVPSRHSLATFAGDVRSNRVLKVSRRSWDGHVYNLQTTDGWYLANGIVTHNCRCARIPTLLPWSKLGIKAPEPLSVLPDARARFNALSEDEQLHVMGPDRLKLLRTGKVDWSDLSMRRESSGWRPSYGPRPVRDLQRQAGVPVGPSGARRAPAVRAPTKRATAAPKAKPKAAAFPVDPKVGDLFMTDYTERKAVTAAREAAVKAQFEGEYAGLTVRVTDVEATSTAVKVDGTVHRPDGVQVGLFTRAFYREGDEVTAYHSLLDLNRQVQGQGFADKFNRHLTDWYRRSGVDRIMLHADIDVGGYSWGRAGYDFVKAKDADKVLARLRGKLDAYRARAAGLHGEQLAAAQRQITAADQILEDADRYTFGQVEYPSAYRISQAGRWAGASRDDMWIGKDAMLKSSWHGVRPL